MTEPRREAETLASTVRQRRIALGMTQIELAEKARVAHRTVQNIEAGKGPLPAIVAAIAGALEVDTGKLQQLADKAA